MTGENDWTHVTARQLVKRRFAPGERLISGLDSYARENGIRSAIIVSCIGSVTDLRLHNLSGLDAGGAAEFRDHELSEVMEILSAEGHIAPDSGGGIRTHVHVVAARPTGEVVGGHCEEATICTSGYMFLQVLESD